MRRDRNAKIIATLGPATSSPQAIEALYMAGVDVFRLNFSHGQQEDHKERIHTIRELEKTTGRPIAILLDLQGPKLRIGRFEGGRTTLHEGQTFRLDLDPTPGDRERVQLPHPEIFAAMRAGTDLLVDDGRMRLHVADCGPDFAQARSSAANHHHRRSSSLGMSS